MPRSRMSTSWSIGSSAAGCAQVMLPKRVRRCGSLTATLRIKQSVQECPLLLETPRTVCWSPLRRVDNDDLQTCAQSGYWRNGQSTGCHCPRALRDRFVDRGRRTAVGRLAQAVTWDSASHYTHALNIGSKVIKGASGWAGRSRNSRRLI